MAAGQRDGHRPGDGRRCCLAVSVLAAGAGEVHYVDDAFLANVTVTPPNLITSISATPGQDASCNVWPEGVLVGASGGGQVVLVPQVSQPVNVTTAIAGILEAVAGVTTSDPAETIRAGSRAASLAPAAWRR